MLYDQLQMKLFRWKEASGFYGQITKLLIFFFLQMLFGNINKVIVG